MAATSARSQAATKASTSSRWPYAPRASSSACCEIVGTAGRPPSWRCSALFTEAGELSRIRATSAENCSTSRAALLDDLADLAEFRAALEQRGFLGVVISCPDCEEDHFFSWSLLRENLEHILEHGEPRVHEPAFEPAVDHYVTWDYAKGFVDGPLEGEQDSGPRRDGWTSPKVSSPLAWWASMTRRMPG
jgi:hypothetical protein